MTLDDSMDYKNLTTEEFELLLEAMRYILMDYSNFLIQREPHATKTINGITQTCMSLPEDDELKQFILWLDKQ